MSEDSSRADQHSVRRQNLSLVLRLLLERGARSRATIAAETNLNKTTVSSLVRELGEAGLVEESAEFENPGHVGRPAQLVGIRRGSVCGIGLQIGADDLQVLALDLSYSVLLEDREPLPAAVTRDSALDAIATLARRSVAAVLERGATPTAITISTIGVVEATTGIVRVAPHLGWRDVRLTEEIARRLPGAPIPILADNDANLAALAEQWEGHGRALRNFVAVRGESGVGAGVIVAGELVRGAFGHAGEIGHILVDPNGPLCECGNRGCLEAYVSQGRLLERAGIARPHLLVSEAAASLLARAEGQDAQTLLALDEAGRALGTALSAVVNILDPEAIVLGGLFAPLAPWLADPISTVLRQRVLASAWSPTRIISSILGTESALRGAAATGLRAAVAEPWTVPGLRAALDAARPEPAPVAVVR